MNKQDLIFTLSSKLQIDKKEAEKIIHGFVDVITETLTRGEEVNISGFGLFYVKHRTARRAANPRKPAEMIEVPETKTPKFRAGKNLKESVRGGVKDEQELVGGADQAQEL
jgi:DNA-binding protein HU-beta